MQIDNDLQLLLLQQQQASNKVNKQNKVPSNSAEFADLFSQVTEAEEAKINASQNELFTGTDTSYQNLSATNLATINAMLTNQLTGDDAEQGMQDFENEIYSITAMLDGLDNYAEKITKANSDKSAWEDLQNISAQVSSLKGRELPKELSSLLEEIEVLANTEQFKMNRGDYL